MELVIDTSALIAVVTNETTRNQLIAQTQSARLFTPASVPYEVGNAFSAMLKRKRASLEQIWQAVTAYKQIPLRFVEVDLVQALAFAEQLDIYAYDAYLIACAHNQQCPLLTLDGGLRHAAQRAGIEVIKLV